MYKCKFRKVVFLLRKTVLVMSFACFFLLQNAIKANMTYLRGTTNTAAALKLLRTEMFNVSFGDRDGVILVTIRIKGMVRQRQGSA